MNLVLIRLVDMGFSGLFSDPHCRYLGPTCGFGFNQIGGHGFQWDVLRSSLDCCDRHTCYVKYGVVQKT